MLASALCLGTVVASTLGCHRRGYTDLYVDTMASEIRDLQDQLYEYDHEYRLLEQELESLRRQNVRIQSNRNESQSNFKSPSSPLEFLPRETLPVPKKNSGNSSPSAIDSLRSEDSSFESAIPSIITEPEPLRSAPRLTPNQIRPEEVQPAPTDRPAIPSGKNSEKLPDFDFNPDEIVIPSITTGAVQPPRVMPRHLEIAPENDLEIGLSQIEMPFQLASSADSSRNARVTEATELVTDRRVVELFFHPTLCRSVNFDDDEHDDGVFLVLQPRNHSGQFVPEPANLSIEIFDSGRDDDKSRIGVWKYSATEVASKIQPIGSQQGIHMTLPWNGPNPKADRVTVRAIYTFENGRQIAANKDLFISGPGKLKTVWAPRASGAMIGSRAMSGSGVVTASGTNSVPINRSSTVPTGQFLPPDSEPSPMYSSR